MPGLAGLVATGPAGAVQRLAGLQGVPAGSVFTEGAASALHQAADLHSFRWVCGEGGPGGGGRGGVGAPYQGVGLLQQYLLGSRGGALGVGGVQFPAVSVGLQGMIKIYSRYVYNFM